MKIFYWDGHEREYKGEPYNRNKHGKKSPLELVETPFLSRWANGVAFAIAENKERAIELLRDKFKKREFFFDEEEYFEELWQESGILTVEPIEMELQEFAEYKWGSE